MEHRIIYAESLNPTSWPGGITTELFIFPLTADYKQRNFQFRLSSATVENEKSDFTPLPGVSRKIMILSGTIILNHEDHYTRQLSKFDIDEFEGDWKTSAVGKCTDFNLMTTGNTTGKLKAAVINKYQISTLSLNENWDWLFIYIYSGKVNIEINSKMFSIKKGDLLVANNPGMELRITGIEDSELVLCEIH
jgi:uncharacterized protein